MTISLVDLRRHFFTCLAFLRGSLGPQRSHFKFRCVHVVGLQRSGTNFLSELVRCNVTANVLRSGDHSICWKHALPSESVPNAKSHGFSVGDACLRRPDALLCVIAKHPYVWATSARRPGHDLLDRRPYLRNASGRVNIAMLARLYARFHREWLEIFSERRRLYGTNDLFISYESLLEKPGWHLRRISTRLGIRVSEDFKPKIPEQVLFSKRFSREDIENAKRSVHDLNCEEMTTIDRVLGRSNYPTENLYGFNPPSDD